MPVELAVLIASIRLVSEAALGHQRKSPPASQKHFNLRQPRIGSREW